MQTTVSKKKSRVNHQPDNQINYQVVETLSDLKNAVKTLEAEPQIAVDLEADSMYHYREKVCLIQIASKRLNIVIDPLSVKDLSPLKPIFLNPDLQKVFHGADYDIRCFYRDFAIEINNLFDTQLASRFLGIQETGLEAVIRNRFNISLNKKYQKKDWSRRPLPEDMIDYAAGDAIYLLPLAEKLQGELEKKGRVSWVYEECKHLSRVRPVSSNNDPLFLRFKGAGRFKPRGLAVIEALLSIRESAAEKKDRPVFRIFNNDSLLKIAAARPVTLEPLKKLRLLSKKQIAMYGSAIVQAIDAAIRIPENNLPVYPRKQMTARSLELPKRVNALKAKRDAIAKALEIDPTLLCNKSMLQAIACKNPLSPDRLKRIPEMRQWQRSVLGRDFLEILNRLDRADQ